MVDLAEQWRFIMAVQADANLLPSAQKVAILLVDYFNNEWGYACPPVEYIAEALHMSERTVQTALSQLRSEVWFFGDTKGGRHRTSRYVPNWKKGADNYTLFCKRMRKSWGKGAEKPSERVPKTAPDTTYKPFIKTGPLDLDVECKRYVKARGLEGRVCMKKALAAYTEIVMHDGITPENLRAGSMRWKFDAILKSQTETG